MKFLITIWFLFGYLSFSFSQEETYPSVTEQMQSIMAQTVSPNAASLGKYGDVPVTYYNGIPNITIPIYEIVSGDLKLPISLSYYSGGIRVAEEAGWAGLGWSLMAGGVINHIIKGKDDLNFLQQIFPESFKESPGNYCSLFGEAMVGNGLTVDDDVFGNFDFDGESDVFNYNFNGYSGKFTYKRENDYVNKTVHYSQIDITESNLKIEPGDPYNLVDATEQNTEMFTVTAPDGTIYLFNDVEVTESWSGSSDRSYSYASYLSDIYSPIGKHIHLVYENYVPTVTEMMLSASSTYDLFNYAFSPAGSKYTVSFSEIKKQVILSRIEFDEGSISFNSGLRDDTFGKKLESIMLKRNDNTTVQEWRLLYDYFDGDVTYGDFAEYANGTKYPLDHRKKRLKLLSIQQLNGQSYIPPYKFTYSENIKLPFKTSFAQDYWGFFNGETTNESLIPSIDRFNYYFIDRKVPEGVVSNREPNETFLTTGLLKTIKYPTGGYTSFEFGMHEYYNQNWEIDPNVQQYEDFADNIVNSTNDKPEQPISISSSFGFVRVRINLTVKNNSSILPDSPIVSIESTDPGRNINITWQNNNPKFKTKDGYFVLDEFIYILPGNYTIKAFTPETVEYSKIVARWDNNQNRTVTGGGVRVEKITDVDNNGKEKVRVFDYNFGEESSVSSGILMSAPFFCRRITRDIRDNAKSAPPDRCFIFSNSSVPISNNASGSIVGYSMVTVHEGRNGEYGSTVYTYRNSADNQVVYEEYMPGIPLEQNIENGLLDSKTVYKKVNGEKKPVYSESYFYNIQKERTMCALMEFDYYSLFTGSLMDPQYYLHFYPIQYGKILQTGKNTYECDENGTNCRSTISTYSYNDKMLLSSKTVQTQDGDYLTTEYTYPIDLYSETDVEPTDPYAFAFWRLVNDYQIDQPVQVVKLKNSNFIGAGMCLYKNFGTSVNPLILPEKYYTFNASSPLSSFNKLHTDGNKNLVWDNSFYRLTDIVNNYDGNANLLQVTKNNGIKTSLIWGYSNFAYPIAKATNAAYDDIAYSGFEESINTSFTYSSANIKTGSAPCGDFYFENPASSSSALKKTIINSGKYILTYYAKPAVNSPSVSLGTGITVTKSEVSDANSYGWYQYTKHLTVSSSNQTVQFSGNFYVDEVRLYPESANMQTFAFKPLTGITSTVNISGIPQHFVYDDIGRLSSGLDENKKVLLKNEYNYNNSYSVEKKSVKLQAFAKPSKVNIYSNITWSVASVSQTWIHCQKTLAGQTNNGYITITLDNNNSGLDRTGFITLNFNNNGNIETYQVDITQLSQGIKITGFNKSWRRDESTNVTFTAIGMTNVKVLIDRGVFGSEPTYSISNSYNASATSISFNVSLSIPIYNNYTLRILNADGSESETVFDAVTPINVTREYYVDVTKPLPGEKLNQLVEVAWNTNVENSYQYYNYYITRIGYADVKIEPSPHDPSGYYDMFNLPSGFTPVYNSPVYSIKVESINNSGAVLATGSSSKFSFVTTPDPPSNFELNEMSNPIFLDNNYYGTYGYCISWQSTGYPYFNVYLNATKAGFVNEIKLNPVTIVSPQNFYYWRPNDTDFLNLLNGGDYLDFQFQIIIKDTQGNILDQSSAFIIKYVND